MPHHDGCKRTVLFQNHVEDCLGCESLKCKPCFWIYSFQCVACLRSWKLLTISSQYFSCGVLIYQLAAVLQQSCHQWWIKQGKSILSCHVMREQIQYVLKADGWRQGLCLNAHQCCKGKWAQLDEWGSLLSLGLPTCCLVSFIVPRGWMWLSAVLQEARQQECRIGWCFTTKHFIFSLSVHKQSYNLIDAVTNN